jgi:outer membrane protein assembly factor BamB
MLCTEEHSAQEPKPRSVPYFALDVETGDVVWRIDGAFRQSNWDGRSIIDDSIIVTQDTYNQQIYAIGKGPSAMTITAPGIAVTASTPVLLRGTIMDVSPGTVSKEILLRFPKGVPAVCDADMSDWMLHVYKQFPEIVVTGVEITIDAIDPNGNYVNLDTTVSDGNGRFNFNFTPDKEGQYDIYAFFSGSASYYKSDEQTELVVTSAAEGSGLQYALYAFIVGIVIIITIVVVGLLILRKK